MKKFVLCVVGLFLLSGCFLTKEKLFESSRSGVVFSESVLVYAGSPKDSLVIDYLGGMYVQRAAGTPKGGRLYAVGPEGGNFYVAEQPGVGRITQNAPDFRYALFKLHQPLVGRPTVEIAGGKEGSLYHQLVERRGMKFGFIGLDAKAEDGVTVLAVLNDLMRNWDDLDRFQAEIYDLNDASDLKAAEKLVGKDMLR